ncbi:MAG: sodium/proton antiporter NhaB [Nitrospinota bacterium]
MKSKVNLSDFRTNFLGNSPNWYKNCILLFLVLNPILLYTVGPFVTGWLLLLEFIFTLAMALKCYPLQPGGLLAIEALFLGLTTPESIYNETLTNFPVILLLIFMVAGIYFMQDFLLFIFTNLIVKVKSKIVLSLLFCSVSAILSAFLDALTVTAVIMAAGLGFYTIYDKYRSTQTSDDDSAADLEQFRAYLRNIMMHGAVGTALGGAMTLVGEPQNLLIAKMLEWEFLEFFIRMAHVTIPVFIAGHITCFVVEKYALFGYGAQLPDKVRAILTDHVKNEAKNRSNKAKAKLIIQGAVSLYIVIALGLHVAEVGLIGLSVIVALTALNGIIEERQIGKAFEESLPFTALLTVFFAIVAVIHDQHLFNPIIALTLSLDGAALLAGFYVACGILSAISDNVFVATIYISEVKQALLDETISQEQLNMIAVAINTGTNLPSVATPNGQAAFLFLLTSSIAAVIELSYLRMIYLALPYTIVLSLSGFLFNVLFL